MRLASWARAYWELTKPGITSLIVVSSSAGYLSGEGAGSDWAKLVWTLTGTGLLAGGTAVLNQWWERETDRLMKRTCLRPIASGRVDAKPAFIFGLSISLAGFAALWAKTNLLAASLGLFTLLSYLLIYTPLKKRTVWSTAVGAVPGAMPPLIGYAAATGSFSAEGWLWFGVLFLWQFPHFLAIGWLYRKDYARGGIRMWPVVEEAGHWTARQILLTSILLVPMSLGLVWTGQFGQVYAATASVMGFLYVLAGWRFSRQRTATRARQLLIASVVYLPVLYAGGLLDLLTAPGRERVVGWLGSMVK